MLCPTAGREEAEFAAEKSSVGPSATVLLCFTVSWVLPGCFSTERGWAHCEKGTTKSRCGGAAGAASCCSPLCRQCNACLDSCHGNKFILRPGQHLATVWQSRQEPVQPAASPAGPRETGGMRDGVRLHACKVVCQLQDSDWWFPYPKSTGELQGDPSEVTSWTASVCGIMMALALQHKELRNGEPRSKEMLAKHKESLPLVSVSSTKKIPPAYQS